MNIWGSTSEKASFSYLFRLPQIADSSNYMYPSKNWLKHQAVCQPSSNKLLNGFPPPQRTLITRSSTPVHTRRATCPTKGPGKAPCLLGAHGCSKRGCHCPGNPKSKRLESLLRSGRASPTLGFSAIERGCGGFFTDVVCLALIWRIVDSTIISMAHIFQRHPFLLYPVFAQNCLLGFGTLRTSQDHMDALAQEKHLCQWPATSKRFFLHCSLVDRFRAGCPPSLGLISSKPHLGHVSHP